MRRFPREAYANELRAAQRLEATRDLAAAFQRLERAHILGQRDTRAHERVHWEMLRLGWLLKDRREMLGQLSRIDAAALFSRVWVPHCSCRTPDEAQFASYLWAGSLAIPEFACARCRAQGTSRTQSTPPRLVASKLVALLIGKSPV